MWNPSATSIRVRVRAYGPLRRYLPGGAGEAELAIDEDSTLADLLSMLGVAEEEAWLLALNDQVVEPEARLREGDEVELMLPIGGGKPPVSLQRCYNMGGDGSRSRSTSLQSRNRS